MKTLKIFFGAIFIFHYSIAQYFDKTEKQNGQSISSPAVPVQQAIKSVIQDGPVDPKEYTVGPGDIFNVNIWTAIPLSFQMPVTPEGIIVIPTVGELNVTGKLLDKVREKAIGEIRKKYISSEASFTLATPRSFVVTVFGAVLNEGPVIVQATQRADAAVKIANDIRVFKDQSLVENQPGQQTVNKTALGSKRKIKINHKDGTTSFADLEKYIATADSKLNPLLRDGDVIIVPPAEIQKNFIGIYGGVGREGEYEFVDGDDVLMLIKIAGGLTSLADSNRIILTRENIDGGNSESKIDLANILSGQSKKILLQRGDKVIVYNKSLVSSSGSVKIEGEVVTPGTYSIIKDSTTLSDVISLAGGFTKYASLNSARIVHETKDFSNAPKVYTQILRGRSTVEDTVYLNTEMNIKNMSELSSADFVGLFEKHDRSKDIKLRDGDRVIVPQKINAVYVFGEVINPGFIAFEKDKSIDYYVKLAGGETKDAKNSESKIIKASSKQWLSPSETTIEEGDFIWIPKEPYRTFGYYLNIYSQVFGIVGTVATLYLLIKR